jgi:putative acetyltransferase
MSVLPEYQARGIGSALVWRGLESLKTQGEAAVLVLGHAHYYERFGFSVDKAKSLHTPFPPDAFMALELRPGALAGVTGRVRYAKSFGL